MDFSILSLDFDGTIAHSLKNTINVYYSLFKNQISYSELNDKFRLFELEYLKTNLDLKNKFRNIGKLNSENRIKFYEEWNTERLRYIFPSLSYTMVTHALEKIMENIIQNNRSEIYPEVNNCLEYLGERKITLYIVSGNNREYIKHFLRENNIECAFKNVLTPDYLKMDKNNIYLYYKQVGLDFKNILHIGDDPELDYHLPKSLGIQALWLKRENSNYLDSSIPQNDVITSLTDLLHKI